MNTDANRQKLGNFVRGLSVMTNALPFFSTAPPPTI